MDESAAADKRLLRFRSVRTKPTSFSGWRESVKEATASASNATDLDELMKGTKLWKIRRKMCRGLVCYPRVFRLDMDSLCVVYSTASQNGGPQPQGPHQPQPGHNRDKAAIDVADIVEVRKGFATDTFNEVEKRLTAFKISEFLQSENCFSIIFAPKLGIPSLDLVSRDKRVASAWISTLTRLVNATKSIEIQKEYELYLRNQFHAADDNRSGSLTINEFSGLLRQLNINLNEREIKQIFDEVNTDRNLEERGEQVIDEHEFLEFYHNFITRDDLSELFVKYSKKYDGLAMTTAELRKFLAAEQKVKVNEAEAELIVAEFEPSVGRRRQKLLSEDGFTRFFLFSDSHDIIDHSKTDAVYQDMSHPLSHYYISTSHNTYLVGNQLTSESSIDGYIRALKAGCRCVELDCWDGQRNEPIIYHGWTLTSKLDFKEVLQDAVKPYAFFASDFPLILSIENHCSKKQQDRMAEHLINILGDALFTGEVDRDKNCLPSPDDLRRKILVKGKKIRKASAFNQHFECPETRPLSASNSVGVSALISASMKLKRSDSNSDRDSSSPSSPTNSGNTLKPFNYHRPLSVSASSSSGSSPMAFALIASQTRRKHSDSIDSVETVSKKFSDLINYCESVKFKGLDAPRRYWEMSSLDETKAIHIQDNVVFANYNKRNLTRIYPKGTRLMSSNFDPLPFWQSGCQMAALNYQSRDHPLLFSRAMFRQNARCGYVLKPAPLREPKGKLLPSPKKVEIKVISGQHLPKSDEQRLKGDIVEPYVKIRIRGHPRDDGEHITSVVPKNGFNPTWNETASFFVSYPELAFLEFRVKTRQISGTAEGDHLGSYVVALSMVRPGYRNVFLENYAGVRLTPASLFVHVKFEDVAHNERTAEKRKRK